MFCNIFLSLSLVEVLKKFYLYTLFLSVYIINCFLKLIRNKKYIKLKKYIKIKFNLFNLHSCLTSTCFVDKKLVK